MGKKKDKPKQRVDPVRKNPDPYYTTTPSEVMRDSEGHVIGEVYTLPPRMTQYGWKYLEG